MKTINEMNRKEKALTIKSIIKKNRANYQFTVLQLAQEVGLSYSYLYETVYNIFDMSPQRLIETVRLEEAVRLIAGGKKLVKIYKKLGYGNMRTFREAFFKRLNMNYTTCRAYLAHDPMKEKEDMVQKVIATLWDNNAE